MSIPCGVRIHVGDARDIAQAIAAGAAESVPATAVEVSEAPDAIPDDVTLLVVGTPTHAFGLPGRAPDPMPRSVPTPRWSARAAASASGWP